MPPKKQDTGITVVNKSASVGESAQIVTEDRFKSIAGMIKPKHDPQDFLYAYDNSFTVGGISDRFASTASSGWVFPKEMKEESQKVLKTLDQEYLFTSLFVTGDVYFEKIRTKDGAKTISKFEPFITSEVRIARNDAVITYNQIAPGMWAPKVFASEDVLHIKLKSLQSRYYGDSKFNRCIRQVVLLGLIDKYYEWVFDGGFFGTSIISDKSGKLTKEQRELIAATIKDKLKGLKEAFTTMVVPWELEKLDLDKNFDTEAFLKYRKELMKSIAVGLNIPFDLLDPEWSARNTKQSSIEEFNSDIVKPIQERVMSQILQQLSEEEIPGITGLAFVPIDTSNQKEEMEVETGYKDSGIMTANEVRAKLWLAPRPDGDKLEVKTASKNPADLTNPADAAAIAKIEEEISKMYSHYE
jgi:HK97 family phage portal protein